jgi:HPt (histidine-containing phosphotransfer) domain-containing protein
MIDYTRLQQIYGDDKSYIVEMFETFLEEALPDFALIPDFISREDWKGLAQLIHKIKPSLGMVGLSDLEEQLNGIEVQAKTTPNALKIHALWQEAEHNLEKAVLVLQKAMTDF